MRKTLLAVALSVVSALPAAAQVGSPLDPFNYFGTFGPVAVAGTPAFAQTFMRPAVGFNYLQSFTFFLSDNSEDGSGTQLQFRAAVFEMNGSSLGNQLYLSGVRSGSANFFGFDTYSFSTTNLFLDPSVSTFALVLRSMSSQNGALNVIGAGATDYTGGAFFSVNNDNSLSPVDGTADAAFSATLTSARMAVVPEPATVVLFGAGMLLVGFVARRRYDRV